VESNNVQRDDDDAAAVESDGPPINDCIGVIDAWIAPLDTALNASIVVQKAFQEQAQAREEMFRYMAETPYRNMADAAKRLEFQLQQPSVVDWDELRHRFMESIDAAISSSGSFQQDFESAIAKAKADINGLVDAVKNASASEQKLFWEQAQASRDWIRSLTDTPNRITVESSWTLPSINGSLSNCLPRVPFNSEEVEESVCERAEAGLTDSPFARTLRQILAEFFLPSARRMAEFDSVAPQPSAPDRADQSNGSPSPPASFIKPRTRPLSNKDRSVHAAIGPKRFNELTNAEIMRDPGIKKRLNTEFNLAPTEDAAKCCLDRIRKAQNYPLSNKIKENRSSTN
jgi:hypothetical protein